MPNSLPMWASWSDNLCGSDLLPVDTSSVYAPLMRQLGYDPKDHSTDIETAIGIGNVACGAVLEFRYRDKANQLGDPR